jgi:hypothetical protein
MDTKITLSFDEKVIADAKRYADSQNISLSRLTEFLLRQITTGHYKSFEEFPVSDWVNMVAEGPAVYKAKNTKSRKQLKNEYLGSKK